MVDGVERDGRACGVGCWILGRAGAAAGRGGGRGFSSAAMTLEKWASSPKSSSIA